MKRLKEVLADVLEIDEASITDDTAPDNVDTWDSMNGLVLVTELEAKFNIKFKMEEVTSVKCVGDIKAALQNHGVVFKK